MTNKSLAKAYFEQVKSVQEEINLHWQASSWHLVVRRAQEAVELILKALLRRLAVEVPRLHDVGGLLQKEKERLPESVKDNLPRIISISRRLRQERELSYYGDEEQELPPSALYTEIDARQAKEDVEWLMTIVVFSPKDSL